MRILLALNSKFAIRNSKSLLAFGLRLHFQLDVCRDVLEQPDRNGKFADRLDVIVHMDLAFLDLEPLGFQLLRHVGIRDRPI